MIKSAAPVLTSCRGRTRRPHFDSEEKANDALLGAKINAAVNAGRSGDDGRVALFCVHHERWVIAVPPAAGPCGTR